MEDVRHVIHHDAPATAAQRRLLAKLDARLPREAARRVYEAVVGAGYFARTTPNRFKIARGIASQLIAAYGREARRA